MRKMGAPSAPPVLAATGMRRVSAAVRPKERASTCTIHIKGQSHRNRIIPENGRKKLSSNVSRFLKKSENHCIWGIYFIIDKCVKL
jgi:hypothetical protein